MSAVATVSGAASGILVPASTPGVVGQWRCILTAAAVPNTPLFPCLYDCIPVAGAPPALATPIPGGVLDPVFNVGDGRAYDDSIAPGWISWGNFGIPGSATRVPTSLVFALSTSATQYVAPAAGNQARVDLKGGY